MSFEDWERVLAAAKSLGVEDLHISGGEPTLYKHLPELVALGKSHGWTVSLNTNGSRISVEYARSLLQAGLDKVMVSLYSADPAVFDAMRGTKGMWHKATEAVRIFSGLRARHPGFTVTTQSILCRENFENLPELIDLHRTLGSQGMHLSYLEGDFEKKHLLSASEIGHFRENVLPRALATCKKIDPWARASAAKAVSRIYSADVLDTGEWSKGLYRPEGARKSRCKIPGYLALILPNGEVHPCNIVEYTHEPVMGNVLKTPLSEIWRSERWNEFRRDNFDKCAWCPMNLQSFIPLSSTLKERVSYTRRVLLDILPGLRAGSRERGAETRESRARTRLTGLFALPEHRGRVHSAP